MRISNNISLLEDGKNEEEKNEWVEIYTENQRKTSNWKKKRTVRAKAFLMFKIISILPVYNF